MALKGPFAHTAPPSLAYPGSLGGPVALPSETPSSIPNAERGDMGRGLSSAQLVGTGQARQGAAHTCLTLCQGLRHHLSQIWLDQRCHTGDGGLPGGTETKPGLPPPGCVTLGNWPPLPELHIPYQ